MSIYFTVHKKVELGRFNVRYCNIWTCLFK